MFFNQPEIREILKAYFGWSEAVLQEMHMQYTSSVSKLVIDESMLFIEQNNLPENNELARLIQDAKAKRGMVETEVSLLQFVASIPAKYPELQKIIMEKVGQMDQYLFGDFIQALDEKTALKVLTIMNNDLTKMDNYAAKYFDKSAEQLPAAEPAP